MELSKYNFFFVYKNKHLIYNSLSNSFAEIDIQLYDFLKDKENINLNENILSDVKDDLVRMKILVENEKDELNEIKFISDRRRNSDKILNLTILPTLNCNFACTYCFEEHAHQEQMSNEIEDLIIDKIKEYKTTESLRITWFGGEPLLAFDRMVSLTNKIKKLGFPFTAGIITNGYLLTEKIIKQLEFLNIKSIQITIDGMSDTHDSRRKLISGRGTFLKIIENVELLKKIEPNIPVSIRVNIDDNNKDEFIKVYDFFHKKNYQKLVVTPAFVEDISTSKENPCLFNRQKRADFLIYLNKKFNLNFTHFYPLGDRNECGIRNVNTLVIGPRGELYKYWNDVGNDDKIIGGLNNKFKNNYRLLLRYLNGADPFNDEKCKSCFHFPTCGGGCPYLRLKNEYENENFDTCDYIKDNLESFLVLHYLNKEKIMDSTK